MRSASCAECYVTMEENFLRFLYRELDEIINRYRIIAADPAVRVRWLGCGRCCLLHSPSGPQQPRSHLEPQEQPGTMGGVQEQAAQGKVTSLTY